MCLAPRVDSSASFQRTALTATQPDAAGQESGLPAMAVLVIPTSNSTANDDVVRLVAAIRRPFQLWDLARWVPKIGISCYG
jgi:hypothetical protein